VNTLKNRVTARQPLVGAAVGAGMSARSAEEGGIDFLMVLSAGYYRLHHRSSMSALLPYADNNALTWKIATEQILPCVKNVPLILGITAQDQNQDWPVTFDRIESYGLAGITNFPSVSFYDGNFRAALEELGLGFECEVKVLAEAKKRGLFTIGFCMTADEAEKLAGAKIDIICLDLGFAEWHEPNLANHAAALDSAIEHIRTVTSRIEGIRPKPYLVVFSGPMLLPRDTAQVYQRTEVLGYVGGSTIERFPASSVITQTVREFKHAATLGKVPDRLGNMVGRSPAMQQVFDTIRRVAKSNAPILLVGESGSGKELAAQEIHRLSPRALFPIVSWNCGAITESLAMSELFGHEKGSFTGATRTHIGKFEAANRGTLFMDEVADLPLSVQASLLRVLQEREVLRVGGERSLSVDVRVIAASNKDFRDQIPTGKFRLDLYYRLSTVVVRIPPLRERVEDIPVLLQEMMQEFGDLYHCPIPRITRRVMDAFVSHHWPGNIRELRNVIERCFILGEGQSLSLSWVEEVFDFDRSFVEKSGAPKKAGLSRAEKMTQLQAVLQRHGGNKLAAARDLGVSRKTIYNWLDQKD